MLRKLTQLVSLLILIFCIASPALSMGLLMPNEENAGPLAIESHRVTINVTDSAAITHVDQVFRNSSNRQLEATFIFPLPPNATVSDFALYINGVRTQGEVLESTQARQVYNNIVRRVQDPGLVEYIDGHIFQASIFPVPANGTQRVELEFAQVLERQGDLRRITYPLRTGRTSASTLRDFTITANITTTSPLRTIYSPTHDIDVVRESETTAVAGLEQHNADLERDFVLYLSTSDEDVGVDLLTYDLDGTGSEEGYFLMVVAPRLEDEGEVPAKAVTFVIDTSGSMAGEKLEQAQTTLRYCVGRLRPEDQFNVIRFSTASRSLFENLTAATPENISRANTFINELRAAGGTAIEDGLSRALSQENTSSRPHMIIFITDGLPTVGETDATRLVANAAAANGGEARIFTFGVGFDVDTTLLDAVASGNRGVSDYVPPGENMEMAISNLYDRIAFPVLTDVELNLSGVDAYDIFPREIPDLFAGQQVVVTGRFRESSRSQINLAGQFAGQSVAFAYNEDFSTVGQTTENAPDFIPQLWATRKIGFLVDQIRLNGETAELRDEVRNMGVRYGLVTPYTSYLAVDDSEFQATGPVFEPPADPMPMGETASGWGASSRRSRSSARERRERDEAPREDLFDDDMDSTMAEATENERFPFASAPPAPPVLTVPIAQGGSFDVGATGEGAVAASEESRRMQEQTVADGHSAVRHIGSYTLNLDTDGVWRSIAVAGLDGSARVAIQYMSEAYFRLLELRPDVARLVALGDRVEFEVNEVIVLIDATGMEEMSAETEAFFY